MASASYSQMEKMIEEMQAKMQSEKDEKAKVLGDAIMNLYGGALLDYGKADLRAIAKHIDIQGAVRDMENERASKMAAKKTGEKVVSGMAEDYD